MRRLVWLAVSVASAAPAFASGGLWCTVEDSQVALSIESGITRGLGNPLFNFRGALAIKGNPVAADLQKSVFSIENLTQHWLDADEMKLQLFRERGRDGPVGEIDLTIETRAAEEATYEGRYAIRVSDMTGDTSGEGKVVEFKGTVSCGAE